MNARKTVPMVILCAGLVAGLASSANARPRFWSWQTPLGTAASNTDIIKMVRFDMVLPSILDGDDAADLVCNEIVSRTLTSGKVAILLQNFAHGDVPLESSPCNSGVNAYLNQYEASNALYFHVGDQLANTAICEYWRTPWMSNGIAETQAWVDKFIKQYKIRQGLNGAIPDPDRFHFDDEDEVAACCSNLALRVFHNMKTNEARYSTEPIPGFGASTLDNLYTAAGSPGYARNQWWGDASNQTFVKWYKGIANQAIDGGLNEAAYTLLKDVTAFPSVLCSNYNKSLRIDGVSGREFVDNWQAGVNSWAKIAWSGFGDLQAPNLYPVHIDHMTTPENTDRRVWDASMRVNRTNMEACIHSFSGPHANEMCPWIPICGDALDVGDSTRGFYPISVDDLRRLLAMLKSLEGGEFIFWNNNAAQVSTNWDNADRLIDQVWGTTMSSVTIATGTQSGGGAPATLVQSALRDPLVVTPSGNATDVQTAFASTFANQPCRLRVIVEASVSAGALTQTVSIWDYTNSNWDTLTAVNATATDYETAYNHRIYENADGETDDHISNTGEIKVRVQHTSITGGAHSEFDLVQVVGLDQSRYAGDTDWDYDVDSTDLATYVTYMSQTVWPGTKGDVNGDGTVNSADYTIITGANYNTSAPACP